MSGLHLVIANKNYSSWSLRPWMSLTMAGIPFTESLIQLDIPSTKKKIAAITRFSRSKNLKPICIHTFKDRCIGISSRTSWMMKMRMKTVNSRFF